MSLVELLKNLTPTITSGLIALWNYLTRFRMAVFAVALGLILAPLVWQYYSSYFVKQIVILVGPPGSSSARTGERLLSELRETQSQSGVHYQGTLQVTEGFEEIRRLVGQDSTGALIGFALDTRISAGNVSSLLPLEYDYLHVLCSQRWLKAHLPQHDRLLPVRLSTILDQIKQELSTSTESSPNSQALGRMFLGPADGATRLIADLLLENHELQPAIMANPYIDNWVEARTALLTGDVDLVFYCGPRNARTIQDIAEDHSAVLVSLEGIEGALADTTTFALADAEFPPGTYLASGIVSQTAITSGDFPFCPPKIKTVTARRLLVCSSAMSTEDAYTIAQAASERLSEDGEFIGQWEVIPPGTGVGKDRTKVELEAHPGAKLFSSRKPLEAWWQFRSWSMEFRSLFYWSLFLASSFFWKPISKSGDNVTVSKPSESSVTTVTGSQSDSKHRDSQYDPLKKAIDRLAVTASTRTGISDQDLAFRFQHLQSKIFEEECSGLLTQEQAADLETRLDEIRQRTIEPATAADVVTKDATVMD